MMDREQLLERISNYQCIDLETKESIIVNIIREFLPILHTFDQQVNENILSIWCDCLDSGMDDVLTLVTAQTILKDRTKVTLEQVSSDPMQLLIFLDLPSLTSTYLRICLHVLQKIIWVSKRLISTLLSGPFPDPEHLNKRNMNEELIVNKLLLIASSNDHKRLLVSFVHQIYLENTLLIRKTIVNNEIPFDLVPWVIEYAPSSHTILEHISIDIANISKPSVHLLNVGANLALKYPLPKTLDLCNTIILRCDQFQPESPSMALNLVKVLVIVLTAFPSLMNSVMPVLMKWMGIFSSDPDFVNYSRVIAERVGAITANVGNPIYRKSPRLNL